ncbi:YkgJ family cysteine cluster protein [Rhizobium sp. MHM7A]|uniref:YkgJ family cysteine cluster protein n=1 Tax=Rhizobium sp. MHM7A TaxID=2583233 RepID=UPI0011071961|nr:YkgJ family cysteine cluster protein [Rhizobium sp. MHM7A]TLX16074.1 hypothetical protein FFR93_01770 [Rhizobium sp. MHM7A]
MGERDFRFACKACGKCCDGPPQMSIREMYEHLDDFVLQANLMTQPVKTPFIRDRESHELTQMIANRSLELGSLRHFAYDSFHGDPEVLTTLSGTALGYPHKRRCTVLTSEGTCGIYERRPNTCRYVPGQHLLPPDRQDVAMKEFKARMSANCDWSDDAPLVLKDGRFLDPAISDAFAKAEADDLMDGRLLELLVETDCEFGDSNGDFGFSFSDLVNKSARTMQVDLPIVFFTYFMIALRDEGLLPDVYNVPSPAEVASRQIAVCERLINENIRLRDREARPHTEMLREMVAINKSAL